MRLDLSYLNNRKEWEEKGYILPDFNPEEIKRNTLERPKWIHFGAGNIFRSFPAMLLQGILNSGDEDTGLTVVEGFDEEIIDKIYRPHDNLSILVTLNPDGNVEKRIVGSVVNSLVMKRDRGDDLVALKDIMRSPTLRMMSLTITEKGYGLSDSEGNYRDDVKADFDAGPENCTGYMAMLVSCIYERYTAGKFPLAIVSMDNFSHNGERLETAVMAFADEWIKNGKAEPGFRDYLKDRSKITFPWSMIDKITPRPDPAIAEMLLNDGVEGSDILVTSKNTYIAGFVNAEKPEYLVIEDSFPGGRPAIEKSGVMFASRDTVNMVERMKVCTCLNPLHTALAVFGCLLGYNKISDEMEDPLLRKLVTDMGYKEALPVVTDPGIIDPEKFISEVIKERIPNPFMPDTPQRIATDTSQKIPIRFGETIKAYMDDEGMDPETLTLIPLVLAGWLRYLMGIGDDGMAFEVSPDPLYPELKKNLESLSLGEKDRDKIEAVLKPLMENEKLFGVNLMETPLKSKVMDMFAEMIAGPGAVRETLRREVCRLR